MAAVFRLVPVMLWCSPHGGDVLYGQLSPHHSLAEINMPDSTCARNRWQISECHNLARYPAAEHTNWWLIIVESPGAQSNVSVRV